MTTIDQFLFRRIYYRFEDRLFAKKIEWPSYRASYEFPTGWREVSFETALNSRCTSDYDDNPKKFHWGMFDRSKQLSEEQLEYIINLAKIPRLTERHISIQRSGNRLYFIVENGVGGEERDLMMIESGMQQQAVCVICAALGVGMVFKNLGDDGGFLSDGSLATTSMVLEPMKPSYEGSYWTSQKPHRHKPWKTGNLPEPDRQGHCSFLSLLEEGVKPSSRSLGKDEIISQLLWAARGRTPHFYKSRPWGMTIPTSRGEQNITSIYVNTRGRIYNYMNWQKNSCAHDLIQMEDKLIKQDIINDEDTEIIIKTREESERALWELGYQAYNIIMQLKAYGLVPNIIAEQSCCSYIKNVEYEKIISFNISML